MEKPMKNDKIETLNMNENKSQDIPKTFFKPIEEVQESQQELLENYQEKNELVVEQKTERQDNASILEKKLQKKNMYFSPFAVLIVVILINGAWVLSLKFLILPKYDNYIKQSEEIKTNYDTLKSKVDAIVGE